MRKISGRKRIITPTLLVVLLPFLGLVNCTPPSNGPSSPNTQNTVIDWVKVALGLLFCLQLTACGSQGIPGSQGKDGKSQSAHTVVTYDYDAQAGKLLGIVALGPGAKTLATHLDTPGQVTLDTSAFPTGAGSLSLSQALALSVTQTGSPFQSLTAEGMADAMVTVTWI